MRVEAETQVIKYTAGSVVFQEGEPAEHWLGVLDGMVKVDTVSADGRSTTFIGVSWGRCSSANSGLTKWSRCATVGSR